MNQVDESFCLQDNRPFKLSFNTQVQSSLENINIIPFNQEQTDQVQPFVFEQDVNQIQLQEKSAQEIANQEQAQILQSNQLQEPQPEQQLQQKEGEIELKNEENKDLSKEKELEIQEKEQDKGYRARDPNLKRDKSKSCCIVLQKDYIKDDFVYLANFKLSSIIMLTI